MSLVDVGITSAGKSASQESDPSVLESDPPMVLSSPSAPQEEEEDSPKAEWILPSTKSQETFEDPSGVSKNSSEVSKDPSDVSKDPSEVFKDPSEVPQESPPTHRDSVAESYKPQPQSQSFELITSL
uniref:Uncharacterized protein n=1 Tax=Timema genevievae TaxID=629358 RepID=A0A7R9K7L1_TIMGE|nr:unnamed protein product [Timema genevievae]